MVVVNSLLLYVVCFALRFLPVKHFKKGMAGVSASLACSTCGGQKMSGALELKLTVSVLWVLGTKCGPSARAASVFNSDSEVRKITSVSGCFVYPFIVVVFQFDILKFTEWQVLVVAFLKAAMGS